MTTNQFLASGYDPRLVALSIFVAIVSAHTSLELAGRAATTQGRVRATWLVGGAIALGMGIWATHYVGLLAFTLPIHVRYHLPTVAVSLLLAIFAAGIVLSVGSRPRMGLWPALIGSLPAGAGIAGMQYVGLAAMRMHAGRHYSPRGVALSVVSAVVLAYLALRLNFAFRSIIESWNRRKIAGAFLLGAAIPVMHWMGMAAVSFTSKPHDLTPIHGAEISTHHLLEIVAVALLVLLGALVTSYFHRRIILHALDLADSREQLQTIFDNMTDAFIVLDVEHQLLRANQPAVRLLGLTGSLVPTGSSRDNYQVLSTDGVLLPVEQWPADLALRGEFLDHREFLIRRTDINTVSTGEISSTPIRNRAGDVLQIIITFRDVSDRTQNLDARARLAAIIDHSEDAIIGKDEHGVIRTWNHAAERIFGYTAEEMIGDSVLRLLPEDRLHEDVEFLDRLRRGEAIDHVESVWRTRSGRLLNVSLTISPIRDHVGRFVGVSKIARDITERRQMERQIQQSQKMEAIGQLTGGIAHDFNNLLGVIVGNLSLMEHLLGAGDPALKRVQIAQRAASRGADLTRRLLAFSSSEQLNPAATHLANSIRNTLELASRTLGPEIEIRADLSRDVPAVFVDPSGLENALLNLMVNARDAMPRGGTLRIQSDVVKLDESFPPVKMGELPPGEYARINVTDSGEGMSRETLERALEPFFTTKARGRGTGLGLAMVYGFVRQSGGTVRLHSQPGLGTSVTVFLKLAVSEAETASAPEEDLAAKLSCSLDIAAKILVVDDEPDLREIAVTYLQSMGYTAFQAGDGASALQIARVQGDVDLVITDIVMPGGMNGVEVVTGLRLLCPSIKAIYASGFPADALNDHRGLLLDGALLRKPYQRAEFQTAVRSALATPAMTGPQV